VSVGSDAGDVAVAGEAIEAVAVTEAGVVDAAIVAVVLVAAKRAKKDSGFL